MAHDEKPSPAEPKHSYLNIDHRRRNVPGYTLTPGEIDSIGQFNQIGTIALSMSTGLGGSALTLWLTLLSECSWPPFAIGTLSLLGGGTVVAAAICWWAIRQANRSKQSVMRNGQ